MNADQYRGDSQQLTRVLTDARTIAVVGLSRNWHRPSNFAAKYMLEHGYRVIPVNPAYDQIFGQRCYASLEEIDEPVDMVDCFRKPSDLPPILAQAIAIKARFLWLQLGVISLDIADAATAAGLEVIMDRCVKIEHARLFGGLNFVGVDTGVITAKRSRVVHN